MPKVLGLLLLSFLMSVAFPLPKVDLESVLDNRNKGSFKSTQLKVLEEKLESLGVPGVIGKEADTDACLAESLQTYESLCKRWDIDALLYLKMIEHTCARGLTAPEIMKVVRTICVESPENLQSREKTVSKNKNDSNDVVDRDETNKNQVRNWDTKDSDDAKDWDEKDFDDLKAWEESAIDYPNEWDEAAKSWDDDDLDDIQDGNREDFEEIKDWDGLDLDEGKDWDEGYEDGTYFNKVLGEFDAVTRVRENGKSASSAKSSVPAVNEWKGLLAEFVDWIVKAFTRT